MRMWVCLRCFSRSVRFLYFYLSKHAHQQENNTRLTLASPFLQTGRCCRRRAARLRRWPRRVSLVSFTNPCHLLPLLSIYLKTFSTTLPPLTFMFITSTHQTSQGHAGSRDAGLHPEPHDQIRHADVRGHRRCCRLVQAVRMEQERQVLWL